MEIKTVQIHDVAYPAQLAALTKPPPAIYYQGRDLQDIMSRPRVAIVGSRSITPYGQHVTHSIATRLAEQGVVIVSGLAYGVDSEAHKAALKAGGITMAVLPSPVQAVAPSGNQYLARAILQQGGALLSSYSADSVNHKGNFVARNEYVAALSQIVIITEAARKSGSLHTANFALDGNTHVMAVPGNITSPLSTGTNQLLASGRAAVVTNVNDILQYLGITNHTRTAPTGNTTAEQVILNLLMQGVCDGQSLLERSEQTITIYNHSLTMLEISGKIRALGGNQWGLA
jgi:DNA processing protein